MDFTSTYYNYYYYIKKMEKSHFIRPFFTYNFMCKILYNKSIKNKIKFGPVTKVEQLPKQA